MMYDLVIIGGGPAGSAAAVYAARKRLKTAIITEAFGGQSTESLEIQNWIGTPKISGEDLGKAFEAHVRAYASDVLDIKLGERVNAIEKNETGFTVVTGANKYTTRTILLTTGGSRRKLDVPGANQFEGKGIVYCASCDAPLFSGVPVVVIGGGNAGFESAAQLTEYASEITLLSRSDFRADEITVNKVLSNPKVKAIKNAVPVEVKGENLPAGRHGFVKSFVYKNTETGEIVEIPVNGVFVEIGQIPATDFVKTLVELDEIKKIKVDHKTQRTSCPGIWAAGDATDGLFHQNNIAAGDAVKALEDIYIELHKTK